ncbi:MAG: signal recognition particle-docking protein FtsY [Deltaproteobacteria bacterium]|nr:signal recognition particle-docking protein FtsY [Deltaproteobacteria bacterium]MBW2112508.1 signal recognition particle-docking protein FtsY [Deltaproteobacteria bacterium]MBW2352656.1 signal recognition particle-docking protein FtsY [Deltaproteobacteria bacterium]
MAFLRKKNRKQVEETAVPDREVVEEALETDTAEPENDRGKGFFRRLRQGLSKTRSSLTGRLDRLFLGKKEITEELLEDLEEILFTSDIGVATTQELIDSVQGKVARKELKDPERLKSALKEHMLSFLEVGEVEHPLPRPGEPLVIMVVGVNGVGKTTTIGKAANRFRSQAKEVLLVAADTFRAAAVEQLTIWGQRVGATVIKQDTGADPSAVAFDALTAALARGVDVVMIDTAGRLHTKVNLMEELQKIHRVVGRRLPGAPHEVWLILDATTGQNAISQAKIFNERFGVTSIVLTKLDGTAKGGIVVGISRELRIPIKFIGIGEKMDDLRPFDPRDFVRAIFE